MVLCTFYKIIATSASGSQNFCRWFFSSVAHAKSQVLKIFYTKQLITCGICALCLLQERLFCKNIILILLPGRLIDTLRNHSEKNSMLNKSYCSHTEYQCIPYPMLYVFEINLTFIGFCFRSLVCVCVYSYFKNACH